MCLCVCECMSKCVVCAFVRMSDQYIMCVGDAHMPVGVHVCGLLLPIHNPNHFLLIISSAIL